MGYRMANGRYARTRDFTLQASVTKTATFTGAAVELGDAAAARCVLTVSAHSGTGPTLDVTIETSADGSTGWVTAGTFAQVTTTDSDTRKVVGSLERFVRVKATIAGTTPSYTYAVACEAV